MVVVLKIAFVHKKLEIMKNYMNLIEINTVQSFIFLALISIIFSCQDDKLNKNNTEIRIEEKNTMVQLETDSMDEFLFQETQISELIKSVRYLPIKSNGAYEINNPIKVTSSNEHILVLDSEKEALNVLLLDKNANLILKLDNEIIDGFITDVHLSLDQISILDAHNNKIRKFSLSGKDMGEIDISFEAVNISYDPILKRYCLHTPYGDDADDFGVVILDENNLSVSWGVGQANDGMLMPISERFFSLSDGNVFYSNFSEKDIFEIDLSGEITNLLTIDVPNAGTGIKLDPSSWGDQNALNSYLIDQPINKIVANNKYVVIDKFMDNGRFSFLYNRLSGETIKIKHTMRVDNFGPRFDFFFQKFIGSSESEFISLLSAEKFNQIKQFVVDQANYQDSYLIHTPTVEDSDQPVLIFYTFN